MFNYRNHVCIVTELLGQSVFDFLKENQFASFPPRHIWSFAKQLLRSVACESAPRFEQPGASLTPLSVLHRLNLVHTDLKPENILLVDSTADVVALSKVSARAQLRSVHC
jgi:dual-specificity kinase